MKGELITVAEAMKLLGVSHTKIWKMIKDGELSVTKDPLDKRVKLVSKSEVLSLKVRERAA